MWQIMFICNVCKCVDDFVDVSCDFEHSFMCGYIHSVTGTFTWERTEASGLRYMQNSRNGKLMLFILMIRPLSLH